MTKKQKFILSLGQREFNPNETLRVLCANMSFFWSWGVYNLKAYNHKTLSFNVNGHHHKGFVVIVLAFDDTYTVHFCSNALKIKKTFEMIYFDQLTEIVDTYVEKIPEYNF